MKIKDTKCKTSVSSSEKQEEKIEQQTLNIEICKYKSLHDILDNPRKVIGAIIALMILTIGIFVGIGSIAITLKHMYPYSNIRTNALGATTIQNENKEITYWLFNTAEVWANSGIKVEAGDELTIRASGKFHTAIHHLVDNAEQNQKLRNKWSGTSGSETNISDKDKKRDAHRMKYRVFSGKNQDALIMQVIPEGVNLSDSIFREQYLTMEYAPSTQNKNEEIEKNKLQQLHKDNFYYIGSEVENLRIRNGGILHFAVNDIILTKNVINRMRDENDSLIKIDKSTNWTEGNNKFFKFGPDPETHSTTQTCNELTYYKNNNYYNAWFDDNVGSFLIIIERNKK